MDELDPLLAFALTALLVEITPGPNMTYLAALSLSSGTRTGFAAVGGVALGLSVYGVVAAFGLATAIENSPLLYQALRWGGVIYMLWLAWEAWTGGGETAPEVTDSSGHGPWLAFRRGLITNLLNPKAAVFYLAILPEFIRDSGRPVLVQTLILTIVYVAIATLVHSMIVLLAGAVQSTVAAPERQRVIRRLLALVLVGIAIWFAVTSGHSR